MTVNSKFKHFLAMALLWGFADLAAAEENDNFAPVATTNEVASEAEGRFFAIPTFKNAYIDTTPISKKDGLVVGELGVDGGNKDMIVNLAQEIADGKLGKFDSLLITHKGKLLFESYYLRGRIDLPHPQASATKSYTSMAIGRAIEMGYLTMADLDKPLVGFLKDLDSSKFAPGAEKITLNQAMTMRSGIRVSKEKTEELEANANRLTTLEMIQAYLEHSAPISSDSQSFDYNGIDPMMVMQVLDAAVPGTANDFIKTELLDKLGIAKYSWRTAIGGLPRSGNGSGMTSRNMVKWGTLVMSKGKWNGEQLISEAFVAKAASRITQVSDEGAFFNGDNISNPGYGYYLWQTDMKVGGKIYSTASAQGAFGQFIIAIDELDLVVVATAHDNEFNTMQMVAERVLPAFTN
ncbi:serine hydrolase [Sphingorhabdus sp. EL138]|uniref:serine hydrolase domain-containing protein n=1 Tax=Sphingorhabdus sp. EL138 TaxID=2073156 RepID=UPI000D69D4EB|nr:serine hydrolase [Sphingorhabdus sp. EL138]